MDTFDGTLRSCGIVLFRDHPEHANKIQFLLMKHKDRWDLPKGHVDPGETDLECAVRETVEETGISFEQYDLDESFNFQLQYPVKSKKRTGGEWWEKTLVIYLAKLNQPVEIVLTEHPGYEWVDWNPPHSIQKKTIDPLLESVAEHWGK